MKEKKVYLNIKQNEWLRSYPTSLTIKKNNAKHKISRYMFNSWMQIEEFKNKFDQLQAEIHDSVMDILFEKIKEGDMRAIQVYVDLYKFEKNFKANEKEGGSNATDLPILRFIKK